MGVGQLWPQTGITFSQQDPHRDFWASSSRDLPAYSVSYIQHSLWVLESTTASTTSFPEVLTLLGRLPG